VTEPFGEAPAAQLPLTDLHGSHDVGHRADAVREIHADEQAIELESGAIVPYDALLVAIGGTPHPWLEGALVFRGHEDVDGFRALLHRIRAGEVQDLAFAAPPDASWTLPLYELALLTSAWLTEEGVVGTRLAVVTDEAEPLEALGPAAAHTVRDLLGDRGVRVLRGQAERFSDGLLELSGGGRIGVDAVVTMAEVRGNPLPGLPRDEDGFIPTDTLGAVEGLDRIWAVGDATNHPVKQGGLAAQQADTAATAIAAALGAPITPQPWQPVMRGLLLTGVASAYLLTDGERSDAGFSPMWWPPTKLAGRYLAPYLADRHRPAPSAQRAQDRMAPLKRAAPNQEDMRRLALEFAEADALWGDYESAQRWLRTFEWIDSGQLSGSERVISNTEFRRRWKRELAG
jgi:sulfide:quinone oxidoreductase